ncbi:hypothetical protein HNR47_001638 [Methylopila jiangsuensis]|uniref:hypothetical protein n=1 Tax=Methylopila jiangsuensis TaxID=586230 RepID=UPI0022F31281|nr:hypothetical protein [Methylopila jiangsuensis]MDR6285637.1 hypothetical protein [Methylopila jiangsuensis]
MTKLGRKRLETAFTKASSSAWHLGHDLEGGSVALNSIRTGRSSAVHRAFHDGKPERVSER